MCWKSFFPLNSWFSFILIEAIPIRPSWPGNRIRKHQLVISLTRLCQVRELWTAATTNIRFLLNSSNFCFKHICPHYSMMNAWLPGMLTDSKVTKPTIDLCWLFNSCHGLYSVYSYLTTATTLRRGADVTPITSRMKKLRFKGIRQLVQGHIARTRRHERLMQAGWLVAITVVLSRTELTETPTELGAKGNFLSVLFFWFQQKVLLHRHE